MRSHNQINLKSLVIWPWDISDDDAKNHELYFINNTTNFSHCEKEQLINRINSKISALKEKRINIKVATKLIAMSDTANIAKISKLSANEITFLQSSSCQAFYNMFAEEISTAFEEQHQYLTQATGLTEQQLEMLLWFSREAMVELAAEMSVSNYTQPITKLSTAVINFLQSVQYQEFYNMSAEEVCASFTTNHEYFKQITKLSKHEIERLILASRKGMIHLTRKSQLIKIALGIPLKQIPVTKISTEVVDFLQVLAHWNITDSDAKKHANDFKSNTTNFSHNEQERLIDKSNREIKTLKKLRINIKAVTKLIAISDTTDAAKMSKISTNAVNFLQSSCQAFYDMSAEEISASFEEQHLYLKQITGLSKQDLEILIWLSREAMIELAVEMSVNNDTQHQSITKLFTTVTNFLRSPQCQAMYNMSTKEVSASLAENHNHVIQTSWLSKKEEEILVWTSREAMTRFLNPVSISKETLPMQYLAGQLSKHPIWSSTPDAASNETELAPEQSTPS